VYGHVLASVICSPDWCRHCLTLELILNTTLHHVAEVNDYLVSLVMWVENYQARGRNCPWLSVSVYLGSERSRAVQLVQHWPWEQSKYLPQLESMDTRLVGIPFMP